jgi:hypothetical protein
LSIERSLWTTYERHPLQILQILNESAVFLLAGFLIAGLLHVLLRRRRGLLDPLRGSGERPILIASLIGTPLPLCSCSVLPAGLIAAGISPGAALVFLLAGPATNLASLLVLEKEFGRRIFSLYLTTIAVVSVLMGISLDLIRAVDRRCSSLCQPGDPRSQGVGPRIQQPGSGGSQVPRESGAGIGCLSIPESPGGVSSRPGNHAQPSLS